MKRMTLKDPGLLIQRLPIVNKRGKVIRYVPVEDIPEDLLCQYLDKEKSMILKMARLRRTLKAKREAASA